MVAKSSLSRRQKQEEAPSTGDGLTVIQGKEMDTHPQDFDRVIHERTRLGIVSTLAANPSLTFSELKTALKSSDGNLSVHARKLEEAGYIASTKSFVGRVPRTTYRLTPAGRRALHKYLDHMEALIRAMRER